ncbi:NAD(P)-dependent oxidoreductase [Tepidibacillus decaturensis]|uniref:6-phosphogluconate dehydrogenase n=1 Tax=Tepidibacillus decaturensis TaxID=1413211 RepID=A0A135L0U8_9BACI|nr:NAD(P)-dependent oxidoreductase [Tepidibacillus decaturensis]KXG42604.1 6-phosphogluconate dehydrogenase [Tepidibacillus decaturensis]
MRIGWIGLGNMGVPMATNLKKAGYELFVYNRSKEKAQPLLEMGATFKESPKEIAASVDVLITMVADDEAVKDVYTREDGVLAGLKEGQIAIDMSTISPETSKTIAALCKEKGVEMLDAPVSGSVAPAKEGTLVVLVGGDAETYEKVKPIFDIVGKASFLLGGNGAGSNAKLAINSMLGIYIQGLAETVLFAEKAGIPRETMLEIVKLSAVGSPIVNIKTPSIIQDYFPAAFALKHATKDLRLAMDRAKEMDLSFPLIEKAANTYEDALNAGNGELDLMAILSYLAKK